MLISSSEISNNFADDVPMVGAAWALVSAMSYAIYLTLLRRMTDDSLNLPMFFGFVGMFIMLMFWPGLGKPTNYNKHYRRSFFALLFATFAKNVR